MAFTLLIVEDEPLVAKRLERLSNEILGDKLSANHTASGVDTARTILSSKPIDLILLDLNLAGEDGFALLKEFTAKAAHTIVVSAETNRAIEAFELGVLDFVPKPFTKDRLEKALDRFWRPTPSGQPQTTHVAFEVGSGVETVPTEEILYFKGADKYSEAVLKNGTTRFHTKSLNRLEDILSKHFIRSHKSFLVHSDAINAVRSLEGSRYEIELSNGTSLPIGRTRIDHVRRVLTAREFVQSQP